MNIGSLRRKACLPAMLFLLNMAGCQQAYAFVCSLDNKFNTILNTVVPLQSSNLTIGPDVSNGTVIYHQYYMPDLKQVVNCSGNTTTYQPEIRWSFSNVPDKSAWTSKSYPRVYETGIAGIGMVIYPFGLTYYSLPFTYPIWQTPTSDSAFTWVLDGGTKPRVNRFDIVLIKTGAISPGTLNATQLPQIQIDFLAQDITPITLGYIRFSGTINIVSQTCETPDVTVEMGTYNARTAFTGENSTTEWKDATIKLNNCPAFYGTLNDGRNTWYADENNMGYGTITNNILNLTLSPNTSVIDSAKGILGLTTGSESATGVGIQMAYGSTTDTSPELVNFSSSKDYTVQSDSPSSQTMPLVARYIQTDSTVTPGKADATVTFTINYY